MSQKILYIAAVGCIVSAIACFAHKPLPVSTPLLKDSTLNIPSCMQLVLSMKFNKLPQPLKPGQSAYWKMDTTWYYILSGYGIKNGAMLILRDSIKYENGKRVIKTYKFYDTTFTIYSRINPKVSFYATNLLGEKIIPHPIKDDTLNIFSMDNILLHGYSYLADTMRTYYSMPNGDRVYYGTVLPAEMNDGFLRTKAAYCITLSDIPRYDDLYLLKELERKTGRRITGMVLKDSLLETNMQLNYYLPDKDTTEKLIKLIEKVRIADTTQTRK